jgi:hypothetical protein
MEGWERPGGREQLGGGHGVLETGQVERPGDHAGGIEGDRREGLGRKVVDPALSFHQPNKKVAHPSL